jgi:hypothetical protein
MLQIDWTQEHRNPKRNLYTNPITHHDNPMNRFLRGWDNYLRGHGSLKDGISVTWQHLGAHHASIEGGITIEQRKAIYIGLLKQFLYFSDKAAFWKDSEREDALRVVGTTAP